MSDVLRHSLLAATLSAALASAAPLFAQQASDDGEQDGDDADVVEEIVVVARKRGDPVDVDERYKELLKRRILDDYRKQQILEERDMWRRSMEEASVDNESRIRWGYDPAAELRMRQESDMMDLPFEQNQPATLFRIEF